MSWELISTYEAICPCGGGKILQNHYGDDWNRYRDGSVEIKCEYCRKKYRVETVQHIGNKPHHGGYEEYFLLPIDYPQYSGITVANTFTTDTNLHNIFERDFCEFLIVSFSFEELVDAKQMMLQFRSYAKLDGAAKSIVKEYKRQYNTQKVLEVVKIVDKAIDRYHTTFGNYEQRAMIRIEEQKQRAVYEEEKRKHRIPIELR